MVSVKMLVLLCLTLWLQNGLGYGYILMYAPVDSLNLRGNITFYQDTFASPITITVNISPVPKTTEPSNYQWNIMSDPITPEKTCRRESLGTTVHEISGKNGNIVVPSDNPQVFHVEDGSLSLRGNDTIWLSSIIIWKQSTNGPFGCANILMDGESRGATVQFLSSGIAGEMLIRENEYKDTVIWSKLFFTGSNPRRSSNYNWKIMVTDILDTTPRGNDVCRYLNILLDPDNVDDSQCPVDSSRCKPGDMTRKHGQITVFQSNGINSRQKFIDTSLSLSFFEYTRTVYVVIGDPTSPDGILTCAPINPLHRKDVAALISMDGVKGSFQFSQNFPTDPTFVEINLENFRGSMAAVKIHSFPVPPKLVKEEKVCLENVLGPVYEPYRKVNEPSESTVDNFKVGNLFGKFGHLDDYVYNGNIMVTFMDLNLPLFGRNSIIGRSVVIYNGSDPILPWVCSTIGYPGELTTAVATFHAPIVGHIIFRQERDKPYGETTVYADLRRADGNSTSSTNHPWHVHVKPPGQDWNSWQNRCISTGPHYNPGQVDLKNYLCSPSNPLRCELGDTASKSSKLSIAGSHGSNLVKHFYTDISLPLSGVHSIIGRAIVVHDTDFPAARGNRLACTPILTLHPLKGATRSWRSSAKSSVTGSFVFRQFTQYDPTDVTINLNGLQKLAGGFHVHEVRVPIESEFPCSADSVYAHWDPFKVGVISVPYPGIGTNDQYQIGDLSGKVGTLEGRETRRHRYSDLNLPLHGINSILGRSMVIHYLEKDARWVCNDLNIEISDIPGAREVTAIASFDNPQHAITGFIRFRQIVYPGGSTSETSVEVDLKHAGDFNKNITQHHKWEVFVNQVGADAFNKVPTAQCVAAGYIWNPYGVNKDNKDLYRKDCNPTNPLRCQVGDLSGQNGPLTIGGKRMIYTDSNLPLEGSAAVLDRSLIIYQKDASEIKLACTNIKRDDHLTSHVIILSNPNFDMVQFLEYMRKELKTTSWLLKVDAHSATPIMDGRCVQVIVHFYGGSAKATMAAFDSLLSSGELKKYSKCPSNTGLSSSALPVVGVTFFVTITLLLLGMLIRQNLIKR